jgi:uncharacterized membrane protein YdbT with pleckstrin-like domain
MLCQTCNAEIPADAAFCPKCGERTSTAPAAQVAAPTAATPADKLRAGQAAGGIPHEPEHELWHGKYTPKAMYANWVLAALITIAAIVLAVIVPNPAAWIAAVVAIPAIWLGLLWMLLIRRLSYDYTLTTQRFLHKRGVLNRIADQILLVDVDDITYEQGLPGRIFNFGIITLRAKDMSLAPKGADEGNLTLVPIDNVQHVANLIDEARREERRKRAIYMASV